MAYPKYEQTRFLRSALARANYLNSLVNFVWPSLKNEKQLTDAAATDRIRACLTQQQIECDFNQVRKTLENKEIVDQNLKSHIVGFAKCNKYLEQRMETLQVGNLKKAHEILLRNTSLEKYGGILRNVAQTQNQLNYELPEEEQLSDLTSLLIEDINLDKDTENHPIIKALSLYLLFDIVQPFIVFNHSLSLIVFNQALRRYNCHFMDLLSFEKHLLNDWNTHQSIKLNSLFPVSAKERLEMDLTAFFENCMQVMQESFDEIEDNLMAALKESVSYPKLKPIQKNSFNYLFQVGFNKHHEKIDLLNNRQKSILCDVACKRSVTTKEMVMKYRCDRKTIQRDFADLIDIGIVEQEGITKTINYHLSFE
ncbi:hypothetical protein GC194_04565 [bacterium]|nr:hypothetical protein [bacterium]